MGRWPVSLRSTRSSRRGNERKRPMSPMNEGETIRKNVREKRNRRRSSHRRGSRRRRRRRRRRWARRSSCGREESESDHGCKTRGHVAPQKKKRRWMSRGRHGGSVPGVATRECREGEGRDRTARKRRTGGVRPPQSPLRSSADARRRLSPSPLFGTKFSNKFRLFGGGDDKR